MATRTMLGREIRLLDSHTIDQIAAGEVVERPSSVVKELVENSLDAGASEVRIELRGAGRELVQVEDNGHGMSPSTLALAIQRHATSKISTVEDLGSVRTYGFRGEALPSIVSVARWSISSGTGEGLRSVIEGEGGDLGVARAVPGPQGTTVTVEDLFYNTPARLKFLKTDATELSGAVEAIGRLAVAWPGVRIVLGHNGADLVRTSGSGSSEEALAEVWGRDTVRALVPLDGFNGAARVRGFASPPHFTKATRSSQWITVNGRPVRSRALLAAIDAAFRALTPERRHGIVYLEIDIDPATIDVNVSPTKSEVRFQNEGGVFDAVRRTITSTLLEHGMVPSMANLSSANAALEEAQRPIPDLSYGAPPRGGFLWPGAEGIAAGSPPVFPRHGGPLPGASNADPERGLGSGEDVPRFLRGLRVIGQLESTFILAENDEGLLVIDQHVAHERVLYERLKASRGAGAVESQRLLTPEPLHLDRRQAEPLRERLSELAEIGFDIEPFGGESFLVRSVPALWRGTSPIQLLRDIAEEIADGPGGVALREARDDVYIMCSCKMAVKAGDPLGMPEMERLLVDLGHTENPYLCPHGRPITVVMPKDDLYRRFKRSR